MNETFLKMIFVAAALNVENVQAFQFLLSRPSAAAFLIALPVFMVYKDNMAIYPFILDAFTCGLAMELIILDFNPIGGNIIPNGVMGIGVSMLVLACGYSVAFSFFSGFLCAFLYSKIDVFMRTKRSGWNFIIEKEIELGKVNPGKWIFFSIAGEFLISIIFLIAALYTFKNLLPFLIKYKFVVESFDTAFYSTVFIGLISLFFRLKNQVQKNG